MRHSQSTHCIKRCSGVSAWIWLSPGLLVVLPPLLLACLAAASSGATTYSERCSARKAKSLHRGQTVGDDQLLHMCSRTPVNCRDVQALHACFPKALGARGTLRNT